MRTWFHKRRMRHQLSESTSTHKSEAIEQEGLVPQHVRASNSTKHPMRIAAPAMASRMSIERYLSAPLSDEPATAPAIDAALRNHTPRDWIDSPANLYHSRETSVDVHSDGRPTFFTNGSIPETVDTTYTVDSRSKLNRVMVPSDTAGQLNNRWMQVDRPEVTSPSRPTTSGGIGPVDMAREWAERMERYLPPHSPDAATDYRSKAQQEISKIQEKAQELELMMRQFKIEQHPPLPNTTRTTDESARAMMAANPKLAWILGGDTRHAMTTTTTMVRPKTMLSTTDDIPDSPSTIGRPHDMPAGEMPRKSKSSGALRDEARQSPTTTKAEGNLERQPSKRTKFYCTFCQKRFHSRIEWLRHERTIHMPEELWVCCPRTGEFPKRCPFCEKTHPSPAHLADHNYLSCQEKPLAERTFGRKDHFLQHISQVHKVSPGQKPARLTELENAWRHPLPIEIGHQALHCGFCGADFENYQDRTTHVGRHFAEGADMMSWWKSRVNHDVQLPDQDEVPLHPHSPHQCAYCERVFKNLGTAQKLHPVCTMWSCSFLPGLQYTMYPSGSPRRTEAICCYCNEPLAKSSDGKVNGTLLKEHMAQHNFRACTQTLYFSGQRFRQHLQDSHRVSYDSTLFGGWTLLLKSSRRKTPSLFAPVEHKTLGRRSIETLSLAASSTKGVTRNKQDKLPKPSGEHKRKDSGRDNSALNTPTNFMEFNEIPHRTEPNKLRRKQSSIDATDTESQSRPSLSFFARSATADYTIAPEETPAAALKKKPAKCLAAPTASGAPICPTFYRRRLDASTRNRLFMSEVAGEEGEDEGLFRRVKGSVLGGLVLHSSLVAGVPALMTNCVDVYGMGE